MTEPTRQENIEAGMERLELLAESFDDELVEAAAEAPFADRVREQPWLIAGVSDGMGMHVTAGAIEAGLVEHGVGVYFEPPALLKVDDDGEPVSPMHYARYQNALALEKFAEERGVDFDVLSADILMAPQRGLKGDIKGEIPDFPEDVREAFEAKRDAASNRDAVFIDSVAFGKWICPREGNEPVEVPSVDTEGRIVEMSTKSYHERGYQETLDTMGRNHGRLLDRMREFGWFGEDALSAFFTWAGGSQNVEVLEGIYGRGSLGDAKIIAERDVVNFRLEHGREHGDHAIVRLPSFLSGALMAIPGGGLFGLVSRKILKDEGVYADMPELAARMLRRLAGTEWVRENPIAQIELDSNEGMYLSEISKTVEKAHERIADYRADQPEDERGEPIPVEESAELLEGLVPWNYRSILGRFRPGEEDDTEEFSVDPETGPFQSHVNAPIATGTVAALSAIAPRIQQATSGRSPQWVRDQFEWETDRIPAEGEPAPARLRGRVHVERDDETGRLRIGRTVYDGEGHRLGEGETTIGFDGGIDSEVPNWLGEPAGAKITVEGDAAETFLVDAFADADALTQAAAIAGGAEADLFGSGRTDRVAESLSWAIDLADLPADRTELITYARRDGALEVSVVDADGHRRMALTYDE
ncbi:MAG: hypothetical protein ABEN55_05475 [Bradymonadaceae bacterium]